MIPKAIFTFVNLICITVCAYIVVDGFYGTISARLAQKPLTEKQNVYQVGNTGTRLATRVRI